MSAHSSTPLLNRVLKIVSQYRNQPDLRLKLFCGLGAVLLAGGVSTTFRQVERDTARLYWLGAAMSGVLVVSAAREAQQQAQEREAQLNHLWLEQDQQRLDELAEYRRQLESELGSKAQAVATAAQIQMNHLQAQLAQLQTQTQTEKQQYQAEKQSLLDSIAGEKERARREVARIQKELSFVVQDYDQKRLNAETALEQARTELEQAKADFESHKFEVEAILAEERATLASRKSDLLAKRDELNAQIKERLQVVTEREQALEQTNADFESKWLQLLVEKDAQISQLQQQLAQYQQPSRPKVRNAAEALGDGLIDLLYSKEVLADFDSAFEVEDKTYIRVKPRPQFGLNDLKNCGDAIERTFETAKPPEFRNVAGCVEVILHFGKPVQKSPIVEPEDNWLETALLQPKDSKLRPNHARFVGESESGKSALVNNCLGIVKRHLPDLKVQLGDPLYYSGESNWDFEPTYKDADQCIEGLESAAALVQERIDNPDLPRYPLLYLQDEIDDLVAQYGERALAAIKKIWKQGRHVSVWLWVLGQSPYAKTLKMGIFDVKNAVNFFLATTIPKGLGEFVPTDDKKDYWLKQFQARLDAGQEYVCAVFPKRKPGFLAQLPQPGTFAEQGLLASLVTTGATGSANRPSTTPQPLPTTDEPDRTATDESELNRIEPRIEALLAQGKRPFEIVREIWGLKPSKSKEYRAKLSLVESLIDQ